MSSRRRPGGKFEINAFQDPTEGGAFGGFFRKRNLQLSVVQFHENIAGFNA